MEIPLIERNGFSGKVQRTADLILSWVIGSFRLTVKPQRIYVAPFRGMSSLHLAWSSLGYPQSSLKREVKLREV